MPEPLVQLQVEEMNARFRISELQVAETKALDQLQEASAELTQTCSTDGWGVVSDKGTPTGPDIKAKTDPPAWMVRSFAEVTMHGSSLDKHEGSCNNVSKWRAKVDPILKEPIPSWDPTRLPLPLCFRTESVVLGEWSKLIVSSLVRWPPSFATVSMMTSQIPCSTLWGTTTRKLRPMP